MTQGVSLQESASFNRRLVLDVIRRRGNASRKDIVDEVALSPMTVVNITNELEKAGLLRSRREKSGKVRGQAPIVFELNPRGGCSIGIDLTPQGVSSILIDLHSKVLSRRAFRADVSDQGNLLKRLAAMIDRQRRQSAPDTPFWGVGVAVPGPIAKSDISFAGPTTLEGWSSYEIFEELSQRIGAPVFPAVDSVAAAVGELLFGSAVGLDIFYYLYFGVGLGGSLIINQKGFEGAEGNATEIGHIPAVRDGLACYCGNQGCLERYLSVQSLADALDLKPAEIDDPLVSRFIKDKHPGFEQWLQSAVFHLRNVICTIENMFDPQSIVVGGSASKALIATLVGRCMPLLRSARSGTDNPHERVVLSKAPHTATLLGAAVLPIHNRINPNREINPEKAAAQRSLDDLLGSIAP